MSKTINRSSYKGKGRPNKTDYIDAKKEVRSKFIEYTVIVALGALVVVIVSLAK